MRVFLDDAGRTPDGWTRVYWPDEAIALLKTGTVEVISLDHDLGDDSRRTGYDVVLWIEEAVALHGSHAASNHFIQPTRRRHPRCRQASRPFNALREARPDVGDDARSAPTSIR